MSEEEYLAVSALTELNAPIVEALFGIAAPCSSLFTLAYDPSTVETYTPSGDPVSVTRIESIPGSCWHGAGSANFSCDVLGYWESDFSDPSETPWLSAEERSALLDAGAAGGLLWAKLSGSSGERYAQWLYCSFGLPTDPPSRVGILVADGVVVTDPNEVAAVEERREIQEDWLRTFEDPGCATEEHQNCVMECGEELGHDLAAAKAALDDGIGSSYALLLLGLTACSVTMIFNFATGVWCINIVFAGFVRAVDACWASCRAAVRMAYRVYRLHRDLCYAMYCSG